MLDKRKS